MAIHGKSNNLVMNHLYNRQTSYKSGVMICRSNVDGTPLGENCPLCQWLSLKKINDNKTDHLNSNTRGLLKAISTSCRAMGHTEEAAKYARQCCFTMLDHYVLNSLFLSTTPDDECCFRVRLYCKPQNWVSSLIFLHEFIVLKVQKMSLTFNSWINFLLHTELNSTLLGTSFWMNFLFWK